MNYPGRLQRLMCRHSKREAAYSELFRRVAPESIGAQEDLFSEIVEKQKARRREWEENQAILSPVLETPNQKWLQSYERIKSQKEFHVETAPPIFNDYSRVAQALTIQPVRDAPGWIFVILGADRKLDIIGARYPDQWTSSSGNVAPSLHSVFADPGLGTFGFSQIAEGNHAESGAALWVQFLPLIAPGYAQIRPFVPYSYQWSTLSFKSREDNSAGFGILVLSWDIFGGDRTTEQDYRYFAWNDKLSASYFAVNDSPSWEEGPPAPGWDTDYAFLYGNEAPYFTVRPHRIYRAAIWCFGGCDSGGESPGQAIGRVQAQLPWVVIGYQ